MKRLIEVKEGATSMESSLGKTVTVFGGNYIYTGLLTGVNDTYIELSNAKIVYETGAFTSRQWKDAQSISDKWWVNKCSIESWGILDKE